MSLHEATSVLKNRSDLGDFHENFSWKITFEQFNHLVKYAQNTQKEFDTVAINEFLKTRDNAFLKKKFQPKLKIVDKIGSEKIDTPSLPIKKNISDNIRNNTGGVDVNIDINNNVCKTNIQQNGLKKFRHKRAKTIAVKNDGSIILETTPYGFLYKKDCIKFNYKDNELTLYANGVSSILNEYTQEIVKKFPAVRIRIGGNNKFHFVNPKFYNFITNLYIQIAKEKKQAKRGKKEIKELLSNHKLKKLKDVQICDLTKKGKEEFEEQLLQSENLEFFDYYYKIWIIDSSKAKRRNIAPFVIKDNNSRACFNILNKYLSCRMPNNIIIRYSGNSVLGIEKSLMLAAYIKILQENTLINGDWEYELSNFRKRTLSDCMNVPFKKVNRDISYKSIYIDYLASNQSDKPLIKAYEVFNGTEEDCFMFTIKMNDDLSAIIFENVLFARASEVFVVREQEYAKCINLIFNYFTDYELKQKRLAIKRKLIKPEDFNAIRYVSIDHDKLSTWINNIQNVVSDVKIQQEYIQFVHGLRISKNINLRNASESSTNVSHIHKDLMLRLFFKLARKYGKENVGTEICVGKKRIDIVVKSDKKYDIYEIKSDNDVRTCIRQAIGQIFDYAYYGCSDDIGKMVIVGPSPITDEAEKYLTKMREIHKINIYYETI